MDPMSIVEDTERTRLSHIGSQVKIRQSQSYKFKKFAKISNFWSLKRALHPTHLLCPMSIVEDTERTRFCPQTDRRRTDGQGETSIPPFQLRWSGGYKNKKHNFNTPKQFSPIKKYAYFFLVFSTKLHLQESKSHWCIRSEITLIKIGVLMSI